MKDFPLSPSRALSDCALYLWSTPCSPCLELTSYLVQASMLPKGLKTVKDSEGWVTIYPQRSENEAPACDFFSKTGACKYGHNCHFHHPLTYSVKMNNSGLPMRPGQQACPFYERTGEQLWPYLSMSMSSFRLFLSSWEFSGETPWLFKCFTLLVPFFWQENGRKVVVVLLLCNICPFSLSLDFIKVILITFQDLKKFMDWFSSFICIQSICRFL